MVFPLILSRLGSFLLRDHFDSGVLDMCQHIVLGALIIFFLIAEPDGLVALWDRKETIPIYELLAQKYAFTVQQIVTWDNHEGDGYVTFQQWDGKKWNVVSDWVAPDWALLRPIIEKSANAYAAEHRIPLRNADEAERVDTKPYAANK